MNKLLTFSILSVTSAALLTQCAPVNKALTWTVDGLLQGPPVTDVTTGETYGKKGKQIR